MSSKRTAGRPLILRRVLVNLFLVAVFLFALTGAIYWLTSGEPEKEMGRTRLLKELKEEQESGQAGPAAGFEVTPLVDGEYAVRLQEDLAQARRSIEVLMFEIKMGKLADHPANRRVAGLIDARSRGVSVRVRMEQSNLDKALTRSNRKTADALKANDIFAEFDLPDVETHAKVVLIDDRILYVGNHNWSESALETNKEISLRISAPIPVSTMRRYFERFDRSLQKARMGSLSG